MSTQIGQSVPLSQVVPQRSQTPIGGSIPLSQVIDNHNSLAVPTGLNGPTQPSSMGSMISSTANNLKEAVTHPVEALKGGVKNIAGLGVALDTGLQNIGKAVLPNVGNSRTENSGIPALNAGTPESQNLQSDLTLNNPAQEGGAFVSDLIPAEKTVSLGRSALGVVKDVAKSVAEDRATKVATNSVKNTIDAVNPELSGAKSAKAYAQVVKGNQTVTPSGIFTEQTLSPSQRAVNIGTRLSNEVSLDSGEKLTPVTLGKDHVENLNTLKTALTDTENKLQSALKGDPELNLNADKPTLAKNLEKIKSMAPREFGAIKDSKAVFDDVVNFGKETVAKAKDDINGLRDARSTFDAQAQVEYPNAFKDGAVDVKTPAGRAIKAVRDTINEHLYNTAPNGSDLQKLVGREADVLQSTDTIATKAAKGEGKSKLQKVEEAVKKHPIITTGAAYEGIKHTVAPGLPGF